MIEPYSLDSRLLSPLGFQRCLLSSLSEKLVSKRQWLGQYRITDKSMGSRVREPGFQSCSDKSYLCDLGQVASSLVLQFLHL